MSKRFGVSWSPWGPDSLKHPSFWALMRETSSGCFLYVSGWFPVDCRADVVFGGGDSSVCLFRTEADAKRVAGLYLVNSPTRKPLRAVEVCLPGWKAVEGYVVLPDGDRLVELFGDFSSFERWLWRVQWIYGSLWTDFIQCGFRWVDLVSSSAKEGA